MTELAELRGDTLNELIVRRWALESLLDSPHRRRERGPMTATDMRLMLAWVNAEIARRIG